MGKAILRQKLTLPPRWPDMVQRPVLVDLLDRAIGEGQHIALVAGSGYGKSTLLADWLRERPTAWVTLDAEDADLDAFLAYLIAALEGTIEGFRTEASGMLRRARDREGAMAALSALIADLDEQCESPVVLVLDDYHLAASPSLDALLARLIKYLPETVRLVIAGRKAPEIELSVLRTKRRLLLLGERELAFRTEELRTLRPGLDDAAIAQLLASTAGWPAAMGMTPEHMDAYLDEEVLGNLPAESAEQLKRLALVDAFDPAFCEEAFGAPLPAADREQFLAARLILPLESGRLTVPQPHRDMLRRRFLAETGRDARQTVLREIGQAYWRTGVLSTALRFWIDAGEIALAADMLESVAEDWLASGRLEALINALNALGTASRRPELQLAGGDAYRRWGDFDRAEECFEAALARFTAQNQPASVARVHLRRALVAASRGQVAIARELLETARPHLASEGRDAIDVRNLEGGLALFASAVTEAVGHFEASIRLSRRLSDRYAEARAIHNLGVCYTRLGEFRSALECYEKALRPVGADDTPAVWMTPINRALVLIHLERAEEAQAAAAAALDQVRRYRLAREEGYALRTLGYAHLRLGQLQAAMGCYESAALLARRMHDNLGTAFSLNFQADVLALLGDHEGALRQSLEAEALVGGADGLVRMPEFGQVRAAILVAAGRGDEAAPLIADLLAQARSLGYKHLRAEMEKLEAAIAEKAPAPRAPELTLTVSTTVPTAELTVRCFGGLRAWRHGSEIGEREWQSARAKLLMAFLVHTPEGALKSRLFEVLYAEEETTNASMNMNLMRLRKALEPGLEKGQSSRYILRSDDRYAFNRQAAIELDTQDFEVALKSAQLAGSPEEERACLERALALYSGDFLPEFDNEWVVALRMQFQERAIGACRRLLELVGEAEALGVVHRAIGIDPLSEEFNRELILRYLEAEEPHRALQHFKLCEQRFQELLETEPPEDLAALVAGL